MLPAEYPRHRPVPSTSSPCRACWGGFWRPFFRLGEAAVDEVVVRADLMPVVEDRGTHGQKDATLLPLSGAAPAGGGTAVSWREFAPGRARPEHSEAARETPAPSGARPTCSRVALLTR